MSTSAQAKVANRPPPIGSANADGMAVIEVGPDFFRSALNSGTKEAEEGLVRMEDVDCSSVNIFVHWLYTQTIPAFEKKSHWSSILEHTTDTPSNKHVLPLLKAYVFGDRTIAPSFRRAMNNAVADYYPIAIETPEPIVPIVQYAFANIPSDRVVLMLLVNDFCSHWKEGLDKDNETLKLFPQDFVFRVMRRLSVIYNMTRVERERKFCAHEHATEKQQKACPGLHMQFDRERDYGHFV